MSIDYRLGGRSLATSFAPVLDLWTERAPFLPNLHSGDVGWHLRLPAKDLADVFRIWEHDGRPVAVGMTDGGVLRLAVSPDWMGSGELAEAVAATLDTLEHVDALAGTALRLHLLDLGWSVDPDPWVLLYTELTAGHASHDDRSVVRPPLRDGGVDERQRTGCSGHRLVRGQQAVRDPGAGRHPSGAPAQGPRHPCEQGCDGGTGTGGGERGPGAHPCVEHGSRSCLRVVWPAPC